MITRGFTLEKLRELLDCFEESSINSIDLDPRLLKSAGMITIKISGVPTPDTLDKFNKIME